MSHADDAEAIFKSGLNCCQAVLLAYAAEHGLSRDDAMRVGSGFGGGMGNMAMTCGAVTGAIMVIGLKHPRRDRATAEPSAQRVQQFAQRFCQQNRSLCCRELLGHDISTPDGKASARASGVFQAICPQLVRSAAGILEELL
ncbi:MAG: C_GCAxxG_C_C family protein [Phycisphaeraceae bacterium]|nr:C_GCAxxG_C_C family protein [Phycisphaeraceae bacterium]